MTVALKEKGVENLVFDPYNRDMVHNVKVVNRIYNNDVDTATIFNVLNVIKERKIQLNVIRLAFSALKEGGMLYVRSTYMNPAKRSGVTKSGTFQHYKTQREYLEIVKKIFPNAELKFGIIFAKK